MADVQELVERLFTAIRHGDADHQAWLREALTAFFADKPVPAPRGQGNKESLTIRLAAAEAREARLREALRPFAKVTERAARGEIDLRHLAWPLLGVFDADDFHRAATALTETSHE